jgi:hypothetical protein
MEPTYSASVTPAGSGMLAPLSQLVGRLTQWRTVRPSRFSSIVRGFGRYAVVS